MPAEEYPLFLLPRELTFDSQLGGATDFSELVLCDDAVESSVLLLAILDDEGDAFFVFPEELDPSTSLNVQAIAGPAG